MTVAVTMTESSEPSVLVIMGVSGSGKSTVAALLAERLGWDLGEGDALHPAANVAKMSAGMPLTDADRRPWLALVARWIDDHLAAGRPAVITCSALRRAYRDVLRRSQVAFVLLDVSRPELKHRVTARTGHFMPPSLLDSQLATLERPQANERALIVPADGPAQAVVEQIVAGLGLG